MIVGRIEAMKNQAHDNDLLQRQLDRLRVQLAHCQHKCNEREQAVVKLAALQAAVHALIEEVRVHGLLAYPGETHDPFLSALEEAAR